MLLQNCMNICAQRKIELTHNWPVLTEWLWIKHLNQDVVEKNIIESDSKYLQKLNNMLLNFSMLSSIINRFVLYSDSIQNTLSDRLQL